MTAHTADTSANLPCHLCGYDLRVHAQDAKCPECGAASVEESRRVAAIPRRPAWRDSDPRWRRRVLAGAWALVLLPLVDALRLSEWAVGLPVPALLDLPGSVRTLGDTLAFWPDVYQTLIFSAGVALLFSVERGRRRSRSDRARPWGVVCGYAVLLLSAANVLMIAALVLVGISALFLSMPAKHQPDVTPWLVDVSAAYLRYGPYPGNSSAVALVCFSSSVILLACVRLFDALRSSGPWWLAAALLAPLALASLTYLADAVSHCFGLYVVTSTGVFNYYLYFRPGLFVEHAADLPTGLRNVPRPEPLAFLAEAVKWCAVLGIAVWLTVAQLSARRRLRRQRDKPSATRPAPEAA